MVKKIVVTAVLVAVIGLGWQFGLKPRMQRFQAWEGTLTDGYQLFDARKFKTTPHRKEYQNCNHIWRITCVDGEVRDIEMPYRLWARGVMGARVVKESGKLYPEMAGDAGSGDIQAHVDAAKDAPPAPAEAPTEPPKPASAGTP